MKVKDMINALARFNGDMDILISDGYKGIFYKGHEFNDYLIQEFEGCVDIGVGGCEEE